MTRSQLVEQIISKKSYLCVGLDTDPSLIPRHLHFRTDKIYEFNRQIIDATLDYCVGYKINTAFYEAAGSKGWEALEQTVNYIPSSHFKIADAKRGDIGNTSGQYARAFFETLSFDAITVAPYMGSDSIRPFLEYEDKWTIVLGLTSNPGAMDFEMCQVVKTKDILEEGIHIRQQNTSLLYEAVMETVSGWGTPGNVMFVVGATRPAQLEGIRRIIPDHFLLIPGVGAQGGSLEEISEKSVIGDIGILVNASRAIIYASDGEDFAEAAASVAKGYSREMKKYITKQK
ncbi:MAG: orotidine-5'-phosphate decarboxylase [Flavisolibacter sp.]